MKKLKLIAVILLCTVLATSFAACGLDIEDTNGDEDFSLATITDEEIINGSRGYLAVQSSDVVVGNALKLRVKKLSGIWELYNVTLSVGTVITTDMSVVKGNCRLALVHNKEIIYDFDINGSDCYTISEEGKYYIRLVGESAEVTSLALVIAK